VNHLWLEALHEYEFEHEYEDEDDNSPREVKLCDDGRTRRTCLGAPGFLFTLFFEKVQVLLQQQKKKSAAK